VHYPITRATEAWLVSRLPEEVDGPRGHLLHAAVKDLGFNGKAVDASRRRKDLYESATPAVRTWGKWLSKKTVSSSQIIQMVIAVGHLQPAHAKMVAFFLGFADDGCSRK